MTTLFSVPQLQRSPGRQAQHRLQDTGWRSAEDIQLQGVFQPTERMRAARLRGSLRPDQDLRHQVRLTICKKCSCLEIIMDSEHT